MRDFINRVKDADPTILEMSRRHCHAKLVSSIVVVSDGGRLQRGFLAWPGHALAENTLKGKLTVGLHDHRYDLCIRLLCGEVVNTVYTHDFKGTPLHQWQFTSGVRTRKPKVDYVGVTTMIEKESASLKPDWLFMMDNDIHDIACDGKAAWLVAEGHQRDTKKTTSLFTKTETIEFDPALYEPFASRDEIIAHVEQFDKL